LDSLRERLKATISPAAPSSPSSSSEIPQSTLTGSARFERLPVWLSCVSVIQPPVVWE
jgi:hypothetical protein